MNEHGGNAPQGVMSKSLKLHVLSRQGRALSRACRKNRIRVAAGSPPNGDPKESCPSQSPGLYYLSPVTMGKATQRTEPERGASSDLRRNDPFGSRRRRV